MLAGALLTLNGHWLQGEGPAVFPRFPVVPGQLRKPPLCSVSIQTPSPEVLAPGQGPAQHSLGIFERHPPFQTCLPGQSWGLLLTGHRDKAMFTACGRLPPRKSSLMSHYTPCCCILASLRWSCSIFTCFISFSGCLLSQITETTATDHTYQCPCSGPARGLSR